jgi:hypothetical protein
VSAEEAEEEEGRRSMRKRRRGEKGKGKRRRTRVMFCGGKGDGAVVVFLGRTILFRRSLGRGDDVHLFFLLVCLSALCACVDVQR